MIAGIPVLRVMRQGPEAVHFITSALEEGQEVHIKLDWERRFDHMQQHTGEGGMDRFYCQSLIGKVSFVFTYSSPNRCYFVFSVNRVVISKIFFKSYVI